MKFLLDQDVYAATARFLRHLGHDVVTVGEMGRHQAADSDLLHLAKEQARIFVTNPSFYAGCSTSGIENRYCRAFGK